MQEPFKNDRGWWFTQPLPARHAGSSFTAHGPYPTQEDALLAQQGVTRLEIAARHLAYLTWEDSVAPGMLPRMVDEEWPNHLAAVKVVYGILTPHLMLKEAYRRGVETGKCWPDTTPTERIVDSIWRHDAEQLHLHKPPTTADDLMAWFMARPGISWGATINDVMEALCDIEGRDIEAERQSYNASVREER